MNLKNRGVLIGLFSAIFWACNTVILSKSVENSTIFFFPLIVAFLHDFFSGIYLFIKSLASDFSQKELRNVFSKKSSLFMFLASILGGPIGMGSYLMSAKYIGASYSSSISVLYPVFGAIFSKLFFRKSLSKNKKLAVFFSILGLFILSFSLENLDGYPNYKLGFLFALVCTASWGLEGSVAEYFMQNENISSNVTVLFRQLSSAFFYIFFIVPWIGGFSLMREKIQFLQLVFIMGSAFLGAISYSLWYRAIDILGGAIGMLLNSSYVLWIVAIEFFFFHGEVDMKFIFALTMIIFSILILVKERDM